MAETMDCANIFGVQKSKWIKTHTVRSLCTECSGCSHSEWLSSFDMGENNNGTYCLHKKNKPRFISCNGEGIIPKWCLLPQIEGLPILKDKDLKPKYHIGSTVKIRVSTESSAKYIEEGNLKNIPTLSEKKGRIVEIHTNINEFESKSNIITTMDRTYEIVVDGKIIKLSEEDLNLCKS